MARRAPTPRRLPHDHCEGRNATITPCREPATHCHVRPTGGVQWTCGEHLPFTAWGTTIWPVTELIRLPRTA